MAKVKKVVEKKESKKTAGKKGTAKKAEKSYICTRIND